MDYNILNGGLVIKAGDKLFISDICNYSGTHILSGDKEKIEGLFWFMNYDNGYLYYSDQLRGNALYRINIDSRKKELLLEEPCYGLLLRGEYLYYINEKDRMLYCCTAGGKAPRRLTAEQTESFIIENGNIFYCTPQGIKVCNETGTDAETVSDALTSTMVLAGDMLAFTDKRKQYALTLLDVKTGKMTVLDEIAASGINTDGRYLYCANRLNGSSIYRIDAQYRSSIRICGESADYLHVLDKELYFCSRREWHKISLTGGNAVKILL